jgi:WD40 repeat protein
VGLRGRRYDTPVIHVQPKIDSMTVLRRVKNTTIVLLLFAFLVGCGGESTQDKFMRIAKERAEIRAAAEESEQSSGDAVALAEAKTTGQQKSNDPPKTTQPAAPESATPKAVATEVAAAPESTREVSSNAKPSTPALTTVSSTSKSTPSDVKSAVKVTPDASLPRRDQVMTFGRLGEQVAFVGSRQSIGVYDVETKKVRRQLYCPKLSPISLAISENGKLLAAGGVDGGLKVFPIESIDRFDRFQQNRLLRRDATPPRRAHDGPVSAIAVNDSVGIVATGGTDGVIKLWSTRDPSPVQLTGNGEGCVDLLSYQDDALLFSAHKDGVSSWQVGEQQTEAKPFSKTPFAEPPTTMTPVPGGKGFVVGDAGGRVTLWTPENDELTESSFSAHNAAIDAVGFAADGKSLVTVARDGDIAKWNLPITPQRSFKVVETPPFVVASPAGRYVGMTSRESNFDLYSVADGKAVRRHSIGSGTVTAADFSGDGRLVALATDSGRVFFQDENRRPLAYRDLATGKIDRLRRTPDGNHFVFTTASGTVGLAAYPILDGGVTDGATGGVTAELTATNGSGTMILVSLGSDLRLVRVSDGQVMRSARIGEGTASAIALDDNVAIVGTSTGGLLRWPIVGPETEPESVATNVHASGIVAIGLTRRGSVWSCDASGQSKQTRLKEQREADDEKAESDRSTQQDASSEFSLEQPADSVIIAGGFLVATRSDSVQIVGEDGKTVATMPTGDKAAMSVAVHATSGNVAACQSSGDLWIRFNENGSVKRITLPMPNPTSLVWSLDGGSVAATNGDRVAIVNVATERIVSQLLIASKPTKLVHWSDERTHFLDRSDRLDSFTPPQVSWEVSIDETVSDAMVGNDGKTLFVCTAKGSLILMDAANGNVVQRVATGRTKLRSLTPIPGGQRTAFLSGTNEIVIVGDDGALSEVPSSSVLGLRSLAASDEGGYLFAVNEGGQILSWDLNQLEQTPRIIPCDVDARMAVVADANRLIAVAADGPAVAIVSLDTQVDVIAQAGNQIVDSAVSSGGQFVAISDRSEKVRLISLTGQPNREVMSDQHAFGKLSIHPSATHVAAIGADQTGDGNALVIWKTTDLKSIGMSPLDPGADRLTYSRDGGLIAVGFTDGHVEVFDASSANRLESLPPIDGLQQIAFNQQGSKLLIAKADGSIQVEPLTALGQANASDAAIATMGFHGGGKYLLCGSIKGEMTLWNHAEFSAPQAVFKGLDAPIVHTAVSADGRYVLSVFDDDEFSTLIWDLDPSRRTSTQIEPRIVIRSVVRSTVASFTSDAKYLLIGGIDGMIRAWNLDDGSEVARFRGHQGPIMDIEPLSQPRRFVSGGNDHSIRSWEFPNSLSSPRADVPQGTLADTTQLKDLAPSEPFGDSQADDPNDAARQALISGVGTVDIIDLMNGAQDVVQDVKTSLTRLLAMENNVSVDAATLSKERRRLASAQRRLDPSNRGQNLSSFVDGLTNLTFVGETNFEFGLGKKYRPIRLLFADRFLYAARPSSATATVRSRDDDDDPVNDGDNGALLSWDFKYSGLQAHAWDTGNLNVQQLFALSESGGVFTVPQMMLFEQDGSSREFGTVASWAISQGASPERQYLAVGSAGGQQAEDDILKIFDIADFTHETVTPYSKYRSFEGVVTAMAFANHSPTIAFCVRERAVHRLFIADAETLTLKLLEEHSHDRPFLVVNKGTGAGARSSSAPAGITSLAFSPDDGTLLAHGRYSQSLHKLSTWKLSWNDSRQLTSFEKDRRELENTAGPFFIESGHPSVRFVAKPGETSNFRRVLVQTKNGFSLVNVASEKAEQQIDFLSTHRGVPQYAISDDGRWIAMGDDSGMAYVWDSLKGGRYSLTMTSELEDRMAETKSRIRDVREKPAHSGPIVGIALSPADPGRDYPAFAATIGEENKIKVWELFPILDPEVGLRARN